MQLQAAKEIKKILSGFKQIYVMFSGGRDSLVALHMTWSAFPEKTRALFINTGIATPGLVDYVKEIAKEMNIELIIVGPKYDYFELVQKKGFPTITHRWCKHYLKLQPLQEFLKDKNKQEIVLVTGVRKDESWMKSHAVKLYLHPMFGVYTYAPIYEFTSDDVEEYIKTHGLKKNPLYDIYGKAYDCWCSAYKSPADFAILALKNPEFFQKFVEAEAKLRKGGSGLFYNHERIYFKDIQKNPEYYLQKYSRTYKCPLCRTLI
ncbi:phosphoadenosine phosphosulfate reductase family protein [Acidianus ambivalens]|uniref:Phosphoadenosine phosphosulfate reductase family protein n=1 Tax=Acidianus ambivalens TaxID=2283 RepID=A0A650CT88_ACIAM|nr:phosphoadenosine phosphosulfate reductase family protein [Acidianus ambivalens]MQL56446.1 phosphoadenosine phosphosulfate reductase family protein [Acidianus ambivalens]QGR21081.1 phosphoadenosine phosphosulfate reductase family protein [Acidianus ambivalens]